MNAIAKIFLKPLEKLRRFCFRSKQQFITSNIEDIIKTNESIKSIINKGDAFMISRFGSEISVLNVYLQKQRTKIEQYINYVKTGVDEEYSDQIRHIIRNNNGVFPTTDNSLNRFAEITIDASKQIDMLGVWKFLPLEEKLYRLTCPQATLVSPIGCEAYYFEDPWTKELRDKRVLVIHPFSESIQRQYKKRKLLFKDPDFLPEFHLSTIKAVQSIAGNKVDFNTWEEALESMKAEMLKNEFDIAIIGAGAYGLPLAAYTKQLGKIAIHLGGAVQILFGIKGKRWDDHPIISKLYNDHWVRPLSSEIPRSFINVEGGCYW